jgi:hypothetical protein
MTVLLVCSFLITACDSNKNELVEVAVIQQFSPFMNEWQNVTLFYGFGENYNMAMKMVNAFKPNSERPLRVQTYKIKWGELKGVYDLKSR